MLRFSLQYFLLFTAMATVFPYFQMFLRARGFTPSQVGDLLGLNSLAIVVGPLVIGYLADRFGRRRLALAGCFLVFGLLMVPLNAATSFWVAAVLVVGVGFTLQTTIPLNDTLASSELPRAGRQYGLVRGWGSVGFIATLAVVTVLRLIDEKSSTSMMQAMLVTSALAFANSLTLPDSHTSTHHRAAKAEEGGRFDWAFWLFIIAAAFQRLGITGYYSFFTQYLHDELGMERGAWVWAIGPIAEMTVLFCGSFLVRRFGVRRMLMISMAAVSVRMLVYSALPVLPAVLPAQCLHALTFAAFHLACIEFIRRKFSPARRGMAMALYMSLAIALPSWAASSAGGRIIESYGYATLYLAYSLPPLIGIAVVGLSGQRLNPPMKEWPVGGEGDGEAADGQ